MPIHPFTSRVVILLEQDFESSSRHLSVTPTIPNKLQICPFQHISKRSDFGISNTNKLGPYPQVSNWLSYIKQAWPLDKCGMLLTILLCSSEMKDVYYHCMPWILKPATQAIMQKWDYSGKWKPCTSIACKLVMNIKMLLLTVTKKWTLKLYHISWKALLFVIQLSQKTNSKVKSAPSTTIYVRATNFWYLRNSREVQPFAMDMTPSSVTRTHLSCKIRYKPFTFI